ncbi:MULTISPECIES: hypothetical protein [unclassified Bradyrhizobium]|uniref:hypothetical protein n=1 Tax=unclassified Bradyrhizobium TaxID=2631580 RepID=UPI002FF35677
MLDGPSGGDDGGSGTALVSFARDLVGLPPPAAGCSIQDDTSGEPKWRMNEIAACLVEVWGEIPRDIQEALSRPQ